MGGRANRGSWLEQQREQVDPMRKNRDIMAQELELDRIIIALIKGVDQDAICPWKGELWGEEGDADETRLVESIIPRS